MEPGFRHNPDLARDLVNVVVGTAWQTLLVLLPVYVVLMRPVPALVTAAGVGLTTWFLKKNWYDHLDRTAGEPAAARTEGAALS
jgi:hypothetical protein